MLCIYICYYYSLLISYNKKIMKKWFFTVKPRGLKNFSYLSPELQTGSAMSN